MNACPHCADPYATFELRHVGREAWGLCQPHGTRWCIGTNLFDGWRTETVADWTASLVEFDHYAEVTP